MAARTGAGGGVATSERPVYRPDAIEAPGAPPRPAEDRGNAPVLAKGLGLFSLALGVPQVVAPRLVNRLTGIDDTATTRAVTRMVGARELMAAAGILRNRKPVGWLWARVAGDVQDLALLGVALGRNGDRRTRAAAGAAAGVLALDVLAAVRQGRKGNDHAGMAEGTTAITVNKPVEEVYAIWRDFTRLPEFMTHLESVTVDGRRSHWVAKAPLGTTVEWDAEIVDDTPNERISWRSADGADVRNEGTVRFGPAPGGRGTEVVVELRYDAPAGAAGRAVAKMLGEEPVQQMRDDLRRFKQVVETGEVVVSDASPRGTHARDHATQREAQPLEGRR